MNVCRNLNYYYQQTAQSNFVKKSITITAALAFYTFHNIKYAALVPAAFSSLIIAVPSSIIGAHLFALIFGLDFVSRRIFGIETLDQIPTNRVQEIILKINSIAQYILPKLTHSLVIVNLSPYIVVKATIDYIEDITTQISQIALDTLGIPVQLSISRRKLQSILNEWKANALLEENREEASKRIINFHKDSADLIRSIISFGGYLDLSNCHLRTLPDIFDYKPFSNITMLSLTNNQFTALPAKIYSLPRNCIIYIGGNQFPPEEIERITTTTNERDYEGPEIRDASIEDTDNTQELASYLRELVLRRRADDSISPTENLYRALYRAVGREPQHLSNLQQSETLRSWLSRLSEVSDYRRANEETRTALITNVINYLEEANRNTSFNDIFKSLIEGAAENCGDRIALSILHLDIAYQLVSIDTSDMRRLSEFLLRGSLAMDLLEECARQKILSMKRKVDEIEIYLGYPISLKERLNLPISQNTMLYFNCSSLTVEDLDAAREFVMSHLNNEDACLTFLVNHDTWKMALASYNPEAYTAIENKKTEDLEFAECTAEYRAVDHEYKQGLKWLSSQALREFAPSPP